MRLYPVPMELRGEEKLLGDYLSGRQVIYLAAGVGAAALLGYVLHSLARLVFGSSGVASAIGVLPIPFVLGLAAALAFLPAGWMGIVPGPENAASPDPFDPPMRLDQYLRLRRAFDAKVKVLPYKRPGHEVLPPLFRHRILDRKERKR